MLGPPGAGKGTQAERISNKLGIAHISSGNLFRDNLSRKTELGEKARKFIDAGKLVPDDLTIAMVKDRLGRPDCEQGALLDGFPRTPAQAEALRGLLNERNESIHLVPFIDVPEDELIGRLSERLTCKAKGHVFHNCFNPPKREGICDFDGSELYQRRDDEPETVKKRIQVYMNETKPLVDYYKKQGKLVYVDGTKSIDEVTDEILSTVNDSAWT